MYVYVCVCVCVCVKERVYVCVWAHSQLFNEQMKLTWIHSASRRQAVNLIRQTSLESAQNQTQKLSVYKTSGSKTKNKKKTHTHKKVID